MRSHNSSPSSSGEDNSADSDSYSDSTDTSKPSRPLAGAGAGKINFILGPKPAAEAAKEDNAQRSILAEAEAAKKAKESEKDDEDKEKKSADKDSDTSTEPDAAPEAPRRANVVDSLRDIFKNDRAETSPADTTEAAPDTDSNTEETPSETPIETAPETPEQPQEDDESSAPVSIGALAAARLQSLANRPSTDTESEPSESEPSEDEAPTTPPLPPVPPTPSPQNTTPPTPNTAPPAPATPNSTPNGPAGAGAAGNVPPNNPNGPPPINPNGPAGPNNPNGPPQGPNGPAGPGNPNGPPQGPNGPGGPNNPNAAPGGGGGGHNAINPFLANVVPAAATVASLNQANRLVRRNNGVVGPLVAFLAANYLSKRRDRKINRNVNKIDNRLKDTETQAAAERARLRKTEADATVQRREQARQKEQLAVIERDKARTDKSPATTIQNQYEQTINSSKIEANASTQNTIVNAAEIAVEAAAVPMAVAAAELRQNQQQELRESARLAAAEAHASQSRAERTTRPQEREVPTSFRQGPERQNQERPEPLPPRESRIDSRHELKDDPAAASAFQNTGQTPYPAQQPPAAAQQPLPSLPPATTLAPVANPPKVPTSTNDDIYKQSMQKGFMIGIAVVVLGLIAYFFL